MHFFSEEANFQNAVYYMILLMAFWEWQNYKDGKETGVIIRQGSDDYKAEF